MGLRELKKEKTRKMISEVATDLFIKKGYNKVTMAEVAMATEVSLSTVFNYFPRKESLVFDLEDEIDTEIVMAIADREKNQSILDSLHDYFYSSKIFNVSNQKKSAKFMKLVRSSPELVSYFRSMWSRYENTLSREIESKTRSSKAEAECMARLILEGVSFAFNSSSPKDSLNLIFRILKNGWDK